MHVVKDFFRPSTPSFSASGCWKDFANGVCFENYKKMNADHKFDTILKTVFAAFFAGLITAIFINYYAAPFSSAAAGSFAFAAATSKSGVKFNFEKAIEETAGLIKKKL